MPTFWATNSGVGARAATGEAMPVLKGNGATGLTPLTTSGSSQIVQKSAADWSASAEGFVTIRCDGAVWVSIAAAPTAASEADFYIGADERFEISVQNGDKIAVINA